MPPTERPSRYLNCEPATLEGRQALLEGIINFGFRWTCSRCLDRTVSQGVRVLLILALAWRQVVPPFLGFKVLGSRVEGYFRLGASGLLRALSW